MGSLSRFPARMPSLALALALSLVQALGLLLMLRPVLMLVLGQGEVVVGYLYRQGVVVLRPRALVLLQQERKGVGV